MSRRDLRRSNRVPIVSPSRRRLARPVDIVRSRVRSFREYPRAPRTAFAPCTCASHVAHRNASAPNRSAIAGVKNQSQSSSRASLVARVSRLSSLVSRRRRPSASARIVSPRARRPSASFSRVRDASLVARAHRRRDKIYRRRARDTPRTRASRRPRRRVARRDARDGRARPSHGDTRINAFVETREHTDLWTSIVDAAPRRATRRRDATRRDSGRVECRPRVVARPTVARDARRAPRGRDVDGRRRLPTTTRGRRGRTRAGAGAPGNRRDARRTRAEVLHGRRQGRGREDVAVELARGEVRERRAQDAGGEHGPGALAERFVGAERQGRAAGGGERYGWDAVRAGDRSGEREGGVYAIRAGDGHERGGREIL